MCKYECKAIIYKDFEDVYGPCGCGMFLATLPILLPMHWLTEERPPEVEDHEFGKGFDSRRVAGFTCNQVLDHEIDGVNYLANFSCCRECAERAVACGYAVWAEKPYPMILR